MKKNIVVLSLALVFCGAASADTAKVTPITKADNNGSLLQVTTAIKDSFSANVGGENRSPAAGRERRSEALLDACLGHGAVDEIIALGGTNQAKYNNCVGATYGCANHDESRNKHCQDDADAVCIDRCECVFGIGTCDFPQ